MSTKNCGGFTTSSTQVGFDKDQACGDVAEVSNCLGKEIIDLSVDVWDDPGCDGDNVVRVFNKDECVYHDGYFYWSLEDMNVDMPPTAKWSEGFTKCEMLKPYGLVDCSGAPLNTGDSVPSCSELTGILDDLKEEILDEIPQPEKCGGGEIDGPIIQCDQMSADDFSFVGGEWTVNTKELCIETSPADACSEYDALYTATDENGCAKLVSASNIGRFVAAFGPGDGFGATIQPADPTAVASMYYKGDLQTAFEADSIDFGKLEFVAHPCDEVTIDCDGDYDIRVSNTLVLDWVTQGAGAYVLFIDGVPYQNPVGNISFFEEFNSVTPGYQSTKTIFLPAGTYQMCAYYVIADNGNAAQVVCSTGQTRLRVDRAVTTV